MTEDRHSSPSPPPPAAPQRIALADAVREGWLEIWYQPKIDLRRKCLVGAEALARIRHPDRGLLRPEAFVPSLDPHELAQLADHGIRAALADWTKFAAAGFNLRLAVNVPAIALREVPIATVVDGERPRARDWPGLILEVSEDQIVRDVTVVQRMGPALKAAGVSLSIDNFGAGFSSFSSLRHLPFAELKLDPSFVRNCAADPDNAAICQTTIDLAHRFASVAVAAGIESAADLQALVAMGCDFGQGMMIAAPVPKAHLISLLYERARTARTPARHQVPASCVV